MLDCSYKSYRHVVQISLFGIGVYTYVSVICLLAQNHRQPQSGSASDLTGSTD
jgi:hypothetical protein